MAVLDVVVVVVLLKELSVPAKRHLTLNYPNGSAALIYLIHSSAVW